MIDFLQRGDAQARARGERTAEMGASPGFREMKWLKPVYVGDTITYASEVIETRASGSRPGWGLMTVRNTGVNQKGEPVISFVSVVFVQGRDAKRAATRHDRRQRSRARSPPTSATVDARRALIGSPAAPTRCTTATPT